MQGSSRRRASSEYYVRPTLRSLSLVCQPCPTRQANHVEAHIFIQKGRTSTSSAQIARRRSLNASPTMTLDHYHTDRPRHPPQIRLTTTVMEVAMQKRTETGMKLRTNNRPLSLRRDVNLSTVGRIQLPPQFRGQLRPTRTSHRRDGAQHHTS